MFEAKLKSIKKRGALPRQTKLQIIDLFGKFVAWRHPCRLIALPRAEVATFSSACVPTVQIKVPRQVQVVAGASCLAHLAKTPPPLFPFPSCHPPQRLMSLC